MDFHWQYNLDSGLLLSHAVVGRNNGANHWDSGCGTSAICLIETWHFGIYKYTPVDKLAGW